MPKKLKIGRFFTKKFNENKKISTPKRREPKCRQRYFYVLKRRWPSNSRLLKSGDTSPLPARYQNKYNEFGIANELSKSQECDGLFFNINLINFF